MREVPSRPLDCAKMAEIFERQARLEEQFLLTLAEQVLPADMDRLRPECVDDQIWLISAMRKAADHYRGFAKLPPSMQLTIGVL